jgi:cobalt-zinc-cadmium resistance protein CzcA
MERYVTIPIEIAVASTPGLRFIRSNTVYALSSFACSSSTAATTTSCASRPSIAWPAPPCPQGVQPVISPAGGISEILRYELRGPPDMDVMQLKTLQDWVVERKLRIVPGIADVIVLGGKTKEFQAEIDLNRLMAYA